MTKTNFIDRLFNLKPKVRIYDLDGTIIDSSHRIKLKDNGSLDLEHWKDNNTKENIFSDSLLPLYWQLRSDYINGDIVILCTARELTKWDWEFIHSMGIYYDYVISRPKGKNTPDHLLKKSQLRYLFNLKQYRNLHKSFYDDNENNLTAIKSLGRVDIINAEKWNNQFNVA